ELYVVGTAGHVDHGKSTLIRALTGIDPDRLREEKERGMTIDLGFAWLKLPSGREVSIVDVPGHERFIKNMLAGVGGIDLAMLVIAADEGVMPQTREHLAILDLLRVKTGVVALTKKDLVEPDWLDLVRADVETVLHGTVLEGAPILAVSAITGDGLTALAQTLDGLLAETPAKRDLGRPRLPIDRVFTIAGFGTIVTGTLVDGILQVGQEVEVQPSGLKTRIRNLQTHKHKVETAQPGSRVAVNLAGLPTEELSRGDVVTSPRWLQPTRAVDVELAVLADAKALAHGATVSFHTGSAEVEARISLLDMEAIEPGSTGWAQLRLAAPVVAVKGDFFVVRTPNATVGGGEIVDAHPRRHRRFQDATIESLSTMQRGGPEDLLLQAFDKSAPQELDAAARQTGLSAEVARAAAAQLVTRGAALSLGGFFIAAPAWRQMVVQVEDMLGGYHAQYPLRRGIPKEELKSRLNLPARLFGVVLDRLALDGVVADDGASVRLAGHAIAFTSEQDAKIKRMFTLFAENRYSPPAPAELTQQLGLEPEVMSGLVELGRLRRLTDAVIFPADVYEEMVAKIVARLREAGKITVAEVRDLFGTSRKYALAILEHLDEERITRRVGDERVLR
ncbi:MAG: selenocysteine-specific translation elongation factor, partial [Chloroflexota bacterium]